MANRLETSHARMSVKRDLNGMNGREGESIVCNPGRVTLQARNAKRRRVPEDCVDGGERMNQEMIDYFEGDETGEEEHTDQISQDVKLETDEAEDESHESEAIGEHCEDENIADDEKDLVDEEKDPEDDEEGLVDEETVDEEDHADNEESEEEERIDDDPRQHLVDEKEEEFVNGEQEEFGSDEEVELADDGERGGNEENTDEDNSDTASEAEDNFEERPQRPLFQGIENMSGMLAPLRTTGELKALDHLLIILTHAVRYHSTYERILRDISVLKKLYQIINLPTTKRALWRMLGRNEENLRYRLYCDKCHVLVGNGKKVEVQCACKACGPGLEETHVGTFIQVRLGPQIKDFLDSPKAAQSLAYRETRVKINPNAMEDIIDGSEYRRLSEKGNFLSNPNNYSLTLWYGGAKLTKSASTSSYPIMLQLNELSPHARKKNMFLAGIYVGKEKPGVTNIMDPIIDDLNELYDTGIIWRPTAGQEVISKFITIIFTADSVARSNVLRMKQYNGKFGCQFCYAPGKIVENQRIYDAQPSPLRTMESHRQDLIKLTEGGKKVKDVNGVLGCSPFVSIRGFKLIGGSVVDIAHGAYIGNGKQLNERHMCDFGKTCYIGDSEKVRKIDAILTKIKTPTRISRKPHSIDSSGTWKASEWRNWIVYFSLPCLDDILPEEHLKHLAKHSEATYIYNNASITEDDMERASTLMDDFHNDYREKYGEVNMTSNVHLYCKHMRLSVEKWGPAWGFSTLPFESMNRKIADYVTSPNHRAEQIVTRFFMTKFIERFAEEENISDFTRKEINDLLDAKTAENVPEGMPEGHYFAGKEAPKVRSASHEEIRIIRQSGEQLEQNTVLRVFTKAVVHGVTYTKKIESDYKYCDHIVYCRNIGFIEIVRIISYQQEGEIKAGFFGRRFDDRGGAYGTDYMRFVALSRDIIFVSYHDVLVPGIIINAKKGTVAVPLCNGWETD